MFQYMFHTYPFQYMDKSMMGLDMYIYQTAQNNIKSNGTDLVNANMVFKDLENYFFYWRQHPDLHGWFEQLYLAKGGQLDKLDYG